VFISDVVDVKINDVDTEPNVLNNDNTADNENQSVVEVSLVEDDVNFLISIPNIENVDSTTQNYPEELYLPDEDPIDNTIEDTLGLNDIIDVIKNFDLILQVQDYILIFILLSIFPFFLVVPEHLLPPPQLLPAGQSLHHQLHLLLHLLLISGHGRQSLGKEDRDSKECSGELDQGGAGEDPGPYVLCSSTLRRVLVKEESLSWLLKA
jgi:hypothetical protein